MTDTQQPKLAQRMSLLQPSATVAVATRAAELKAAGRDILSFSVGEPDFNTPAHITEAAIRAMHDGKTRYTAVRGVPELREAICRVSAARRGVAHTPDEVVVSVGAKHTLFNLAFALFEPGAEVIVPAPYWVSYPEQIALAGAKPVIIDTTEASGFCVSRASLDAVTTPRTRALVLCTPSNPTGAGYDEASLRDILAWVAANDVWLIVDEIYGELVYGTFKHRSPLSLAPELKDRIIIVDGVSKTFAMTGWRIGWMLAPKAVAKACDTLQGQSTTNPCTPAQYAALAALNGPSEPVEQMRAAFERRRHLLVTGLDALDGVTCRMPEGAFYAFPNVKGLLTSSVPGAPRTDIELCTWLLNETGCAFVPGEAFGAPGYLRASYATSETTIEEGLRRLNAACMRLRAGA